MDAKELKAMPGGDSSVIEIKGCRIHMRRGGRGPVLLYLHGAGGAGGWMPFMETLSERFDVIVPDHPGFGDSDTPEWLDNISDLAFFYLDFLEALDLSGVHLVGTSLGGWIATELAVRDTARLDSLTLVDSAGIRVKGLPPVDALTWSPDERARKLFVDQSFAERLFAHQPSPEEAATRLKNEAATAKLVRRPRLYNPHLAKWMHRIDVPTLIVWGDTDRIFPTRYADEFHKLIPGSRVSVIQQCGHSPQVEKAGPFAETVSDFIECARGAPRSALSD
jgi:pimeloyl-ACP methyl ester carboxylesterase